MELRELLASGWRSPLPLSPRPRPRPRPRAHLSRHLPRCFASPSFCRPPLSPSARLRSGDATSTSTNGAAAATLRSRWRVLCAVDAGGSGVPVEASGALPGSDDGEVAALGVSRREPRADSAGILGQMKEIAVFAGPATGLWVCGPLMSLIDTMVIGQGSSLELAALGPGTVFCDNLCYVFMFLSIATSNMVATSLARKDKNLVQHQISMLLFIALICGLGMFVFTKFLSTQVLLAFIGPENAHILPAASTYVQVRGFAWPAVLVGLVAQSASLGMKDSLGPLKALAVASAVNGFGDILLCCVFSYGITGAAWATMISQVIAACMMLRSLNKTGFSALTLSPPSLKELLQIFEIAAPVFITMTSKVAFYSLLTYFATSMGTITVAAHQVMINVYCMCTVWGEPLSQTAQSFMPELIHGINRSLARAVICVGKSYLVSYWVVTSTTCLHKARTLLQSLVIIGALTGLILGAIGTLVPWILPYIFTTDNMVVGEMHKVLLPYFIALVVTPSTHSLEGTLMAGRDLMFLSLSMLSCFCFGGLLLSVCGKGFGLPGCWWALSGFQWARFSLASLRLTSPRGMLYNENFYQHDLVKVKAT